MLDTGRAGQDPGGGNTTLSESKGASAGVREPISSAGWCTSHEIK